MTKYTKLADGHYEIATDKGSYEVKPSVVLVSMVLSNVSRTGTHGNDFTEPEKEFALRRYINADWKPEDSLDYRFMLISEEGEKRADLPVHVHIEVADPEKSSLAHWTPIADIEEQFHLTICVPQETFDWLWVEIHSRPNAVVTLRSHMMPLLAGIESSMWYEVSYNYIRMEPGKRLKINDATFYVSDPERPSKDGSNDLVGVSRVEQFEQALLNTTDNTWLKRIFFALAVIAVILFFRR